MATILSAAFPPRSSERSVERGAAHESLSQARVMASALAKVASDEDRVSLARAFCFTMVTGWWSALQHTNHKLALRSISDQHVKSKLSESAIASALAAGRHAAALEPEAAAYAIGLIYTAMLPTKFRADHGVYYTPPALTKRLLDQCGRAGVDWATCRVLDPACGGGAFLAPVASRMIANMAGAAPHVVLSSIASRLRGSEIDPFAAWLSQVVLDVVLLPLSRSTGVSVPDLVWIGDSLRTSREDSCFDLVIGNPPYGRISLAAVERARFKRSLHGHANLYGLFTDLALRLCSPHGVIAYVTPTSLLAGEYFKQLRALLTLEAPPATIDFVAARQGVFDDVLQETMLATYKKDAQHTLVEVAEIVIDKAGLLQESKTGAFSLPPSGYEPWLLARTPKSSGLVERLNAMPHRLADWGYLVSTGPLVWNRHKSQLRENGGKKRLPLIWAESVTSDGRFVFRAEKKNHQPYFELKAKNEWLTCTSPCVLIQRTTAKEQHRRLIAAALPRSFLRKNKGVVVENHLNMAKPIGKSPVPVAVLAAFLNSNVVDQVFRCVSGSVAVSAFELEAMPIPPSHRLRRLTALVAGKASKKEIDAECFALYMTG